LGLAEVRLKAKKLPNVIFNLRLYVAGETPKSLKTISNLKKICENLPVPYDLEIIDLLKNPALARDQQIMALPILVRSLPGAAFIRWQACPKPRSLRNPRRTPHNAETKHLTIHIRPHHGTGRARF
jgi:hypothetical protein